MSFTHSIMFHHFHDEKHLPAQGGKAQVMKREHTRWAVSMSDSYFCSVLDMIASCVGTVAVGSWQLELVMPGE